MKRRGNVWRAAGRRAGSGPGGTARPPGRNLHSCGEERDDRGRTALDRHKYAAPLSQSVAVGDRLPTP